MLNSWFAPKDHDKPKDTISIEPINTNDRPNESPQPTGFTSPHDAVLARMRGQPHLEPSPDGLLREEVTVLRQGEQNSVPDTVHSVPHEPVYDPFEGVPIGLLMTAPSHPQQVEIASTADPSSSRKLEQWEHLSQVSDLQNELAKMHLEMEGVSIGDGKGKAAGKGKGRSKAKGDASWERSRVTQRRTTIDSIGADGHEGDEEGVDAAGNEEIEMKKREERFSTMADQFEGRKETIQAIMSKLDHLSKALTQFHTLQAPDFEFSKTDSRQNSTISDVSNTGHSNIADSHYLHGSPPLEPDNMGGSVLPVLLRRSEGKTPGLPLYVKVMEPERQTHVVDSPDSIEGYVA